MPANIERFRGKGKRKESTVGERWKAGRSLEKIYLGGREFQTGGVKHLYTLTGNLLAETTAVYSGLTVGETHRAARESFQVGGKGINVAKMAQRLGTFSTAVCFPGGHSGQRCLGWLKSQGFETRGFGQTAETRAGWVVRTGEGETTFLGADRPIEEEPWREGIRFLDRTAREGDMLAVCGSLPGWRPVLAEPLVGLMRRMAGKVFVAVDTYGPPLAELVAAPVDLVKINREELQTLAPSATDESAVAEALAECAKRHPAVRRWVVSGGKEALLALDEDGRSIRMETPPVKVVSPVGSGDVLLGALIHELAANGVSLTAALEKALPLAAANAGSPGVADFDF